MKKHFLLLFIYCIIYLSGISQNNWIPLDSLSQRNLEILDIKSTMQELSFIVKFHGFFSSDTIINSQQFQRIYFPNSNNIDSIGKPELPIYSKLFAMPDCDSIKVDIEFIDSTLLDEYNIFPTPKYIYDSSENSFLPSFYIDSISYEQNSFIPFNIINIKNYGSLREQKLGIFNFYPLKYNPFTDQLIAYKQIFIKVSFINPSTQINVEVGLFGNIANKTLLNYSLNSRKANSNENPNISGQVYWITDLSNASTIPGDYLIITDEQFWDPENTEAPLYKFAHYRADHNNLDIAIIKNSDAKIYIPNNPYPYPLPNPNYPEQNFRALIQKIYSGQNAIHTFDHRLAYVLLIGRAQTDDGLFNIIPAAKLDPNPCWRPNNDPTRPIYPNDFYYSCLNASLIGSNWTYDFIGDIFIGRFPARNNYELINIISKIQYFENEANFLIVNPNFTNANINGPDDQWFFDDYEPWIASLYNLPYTTITHIPQDLNECQTESFQIINSGVFAMLNHGHSSWNSILRCTKAQYEENLTEQYKYPFCYTHSCGPGWYDYNNLPGYPADSSRDCIAEFLIKKWPNKGFIGIIASSREVSCYPTHYYISMPKYLIEWLPKAIWQDLSTTAGECILEAKNAMSLSSIQNEERFGANYFGDPALDLMPQGEYVTKNTTLTCNSSNPYYTISSPITVKSPYTLKISDDCSLRIIDNGSLYIEPGAILEIGNNVTIIGQSLTNKIRVDGVIGGNGCTQSNPAPIVDLNLSAFSNSSWEGIEFNNYTLTLKLRHATISNCKLKGLMQLLEVSNSSQFNNSAIDLNRASVTISSSYFTSSHIMLSNYIQGNVFAQITGCNFTNSNIDKVITLEHYSDFILTHNILNYSNGTGIDLSYSGLGRDHKIEHCTIEKNGLAEDMSWGIRVYHSMVDLIHNQVKNNRYGVALMNQSGVQLQGNNNATINDSTQNIINNYVNQVTCYDNSFPFYFHYNVIDYYYPLLPDPYPLVYDIDNEIPDNPIKHNMECNCFPNNPIFYPQNGYIWSEWCPTYSCIVNSNEKDAFDSAKLSMDSANYSVAETQFKVIIQIDTISLYPLASAKELFAITGLTNNDFTGLKMYYDNTPRLHSDSVCDLMTEYLSTNCEIKEGNYSNAINWFEYMILNPPSYEDSIFSLADLGDTYLLMEADSGLKSSQNSYIGIFCDK